MKLTLCSPSMLASLTATVMPRSASRAVTRSVTAPRPAGPDTQWTVAPGSGHGPWTEVTASRPSTQRGQRAVSHQQRSASGTVAANVWATRIAIVPSSVAKLGSWE